MKQPTTLHNDRVIDDNHANLVIYTLAWTVDHSTNGDELPNAQIYCELFINGSRVPAVLGVTTDSSADFLTANIKIAPSTVDLVHLNHEQWQKLVKEGIPPQ